MSDPEPGPAVWTERFTQYLCGRLGEAVGQVLTMHAGQTTSSIGTSDRWMVEVELRPESGPGADGVVGSFFVLRLRPPDGGPRREVTVRAHAELEAAFPDLVASARAWVDRLTVYRLTPGGRYRVVRAFVDHYQNPFRVGEELVFRSRDFLPYDDGHTLHFEGRGMWIQGGTEAYEDFGLNIVPA